MGLYRAAIIGGTGFGGAEMIRRLLRHPRVKLTRVTSLDHVGKRIGEVHWSLDGQTDLRFEDTDPEIVAKSVDIVLLALPHLASAEVTPRVLASSECKVVDMSGAFRMDDPESYRKWYGTDHPAPDYLTKFVYGLTELNRSEIAQARCVASPGCFATAIQLGLAPLARAQLLRGRIRTVAITGSSGSGVTPSAGTHHPLRASNLKTYRIFEHPQTVEIEHNLRREANNPNLNLEFIPVSAPLARGILATSFIDLDAPVEPRTVEAAFEEVYQHAPFVRRPKQRLPEVVAVAGSNYAELGFQRSAELDGRQTLCCVSALDNLVKGGAGQVIQNMNVMLGLDESLSLEDPGAWP